MFDVEWVNVKTMQRMHMVHSGPNPILLLNVHNADDGDGCFA